MKRNYKSTQKAFTLIEIMVTIIILGVIAALAIPKYGQYMARTYQKGALVQLAAIHEAQADYFFHAGYYWPAPPDTTTHGVSDINQNLGLNIVETGQAVYTCSASGAAYTCQADSNPTDWTITVTQSSLSTGNPSCSWGTCP